MIKCCAAHFAVNFSTLLRSLHLSYSQDCSCDSQVTVGDPARMEPIKRVTHIQKERWELPCSLCKQKMGAKIQCLQCYSTYHPLCARMAGLHMEMQEGRAGPTGPWRLVTYCPRHCKPRPELSGVHKVKSAAENGVIQLFNRQPFKQPPAVELPACPAGSARAQASC